MPLSFPPHYSSFLLPSISLSLSLLLSLSISHFSLPIRCPITDLRELLSIPNGTELEVCVRETETVTVAETATKYGGRDTERGGS